MLCSLFIRLHGRVDFFFLMISVVFLGTLTCFLQLLNCNGYMKVVMRIILIAESSWGGGGCIYCIMYNILSEIVIYTLMNMNNKPVFFST